MNPQIKIRESNRKKVKKAVEAALPPVIQEVGEKFNCELYAVGGCVRDSLLGNGVNDIDIAVVGDAAQVATEVAKRMNTGKVAVYARFGTALVKKSGRSYEFATARRESYQADSRKPAAVVMVPIEEDLIRRDFTINALAFGLTGSRRAELIDLFNGIDDLKKGIIRTPAFPEVTFSDDPLRMLRAIRFAARFGFQIESNTWLGITNNLDRLKIVSLDRIGEEFWKMLGDPDPAQAMTLLISSGIMGVIIPEIMAMAGVEQVGRHHHKDVLRHSLKVMHNVTIQTEDPVVRFAGLLHDIGKPKTKRLDPVNGWTFHGHEVIGAKMANRIGKRLRLGKENNNRLENLVHLHMRPVNLTSEGVTDSAIRRLMFEAQDNIDDQLTLCRADITTANKKFVHRYLKNFEEMKKRMGDVYARDRMRRFKSPISGSEIIEICELEPGPMIGALKERIEDAILDGVIPYNYESAREHLLSIKDKVLSTDPAILAEERKQRSHDRKNITRDFHFPES